MKNPTSSDIQSGHRSIEYHLGQSMQRGLEQGPKFTSESKNASLLNVKPFYLDLLDRLPPDRWKKVIESKGHYLN